MNSFKLIAMLGAYASAKDLVRNLAVGDDYEGFQNTIEAGRDVPLCADEACTTQVGTVSVLTSWNEQGSSDLTLYYGLILEFTIDKAAYAAAANWLQLALWNDEKSEADIIQLEFIFAGAFDPAVTYRSEQKDAAFLEADSKLTGQSYAMSRDTSSETPDKFAFPDGATLPNSSTMWKPETSRSGTIDEDSFRIYMQRTTSSIAGIGLGEIVSADLIASYKNG